MSKWTKLCEFKVWIRAGTDGAKWAEVPQPVYELNEDFKGMRVVAHHRIIEGDSSWVAKAKADKLWVISEKSTGLSIVGDGCKTRAEALRVATARCEKYVDTHLLKIVEGEIIKQVKHQLGA